MSGILKRSDWVGAYFLFRKEVLRFWKVKSQTILSPLINSGLYLLVFGVSFSNMMSEQKGVKYLAFLVPGLIALSSLNNALQNSSSSIIISKFHGDLQDLKIIPLSPLSIALAYVFAAIARGLFVGTIVLSMGQLFHYLNDGSLIAIEHPLGLLFFLVVGCALFGNLGIWIGIVSKTFDHINAFTNFVILPLIYLGGVFFSLEVLHPFWQRIAQLNPLVYLINGIRWSILGVSDVSITQCVFISLGFMIASCLTAWYSVRYGSYQRF